MNGRIKIFSKANMLDQYFKLSLVLVICVFFVVFLNNTFLLGELVFSFLRESAYNSKIIRIVFFGILGILSYFLLLPLTYGKDIWFYENSKKNRLNVKNLFSFYSVKKSFSVMKLGVIIHVKKLMITFLLLIPSISIGVYLLYYFNEGIGRKMLIVLSASFTLLLLTGIFFSFVLCQKYFLVPYLYYENEPCRVKDIISLSAHIMEKNYFKVAFLKLSFIPWMLLYVFIFPALYVYPYYKLSVSFKAVTLLNNT